MNKFKPHTRNQRIMYRIHKQEERIYDLELLVGSLQREKDSVKEDKNGYDCGITIDSFQDIKVGDFIETFEMIEVKK